MEKNKKYEALNKLVASLGMDEEEISDWLQSRKTSSKAKSTKNNNCIFPIAYKRENNFEILPELDLTRISEVWGYEIIPGIILAKKCGSNGSVETTTWDNVKSFAESCRLNGKQGKLPSSRMLTQNWINGLNANIQAMDKFLCENGIDAEKVYRGIIWCSELHDTKTAYTFISSYRHLCFGAKNFNAINDRIAIAF